MQGEVRHHYMFHVTDQAQQISYTRVEVEVPILNYSFSEIEKVLMWIGKPPKDADEDADVPAYSFMLTTDSDVPRLKGVLTKVIFETNMKEDIERACERDDEGYLESQVVGDKVKPDVEMQSVYKLEDFEFMDFDLTSFAGNSSQHDSDEEPEDLRKARKQDFGLFDESELDNSESLQAQSYDRTFIVSGPVVKVYKEAENNAGHNLAFDMSFPIKTEEGEVIRPCNIMLHHNESQMIFCDSHDQSKMFNFDMERGKIVEEFVADSQKEISSMRHITNKFKNAQSTSEQTFVGINDRAIFTIDPRINKKEKAAESKVYKTNPQFSQISTTFEGGLAIGSLSGEIRLYKQVGQNAKTLLPGLGDPIKAVDMSVDGNWIVATTQTYLLVIPTLCDNGKTGFDHRMGREKPNPLKLQVHVKDLAKYRINSLNFTPARFNNYNHSSGEHTSIVTSSGPYLFTWNFKKVKKGLLKAYQIKKIENWGNANHSVVDSQFKFNNDEKILVTEPKNIGVQTRAMRKKIDNDV